MTHLTQEQQKLYNENLDLASFLAYRKMRNTMDMEILPRIAQRGLRKAVLSYDPLSSKTFEQYATLFINRFITNETRTPNFRIYELEGSEEEEKWAYRDGRQFIKTEFKKILHDAKFNYVE